jgi:hypothetical protein
MTLDLDGISVDHANRAHAQGKQRLVVGIPQAHHTLRLDLRRRAAVLVVHRRD